MAKQQRHSRVSPYQSRGCFFFARSGRHTRYWRDWSSDVCSSDLGATAKAEPAAAPARANVSVVVAVPKLQERATSLETSGKAQFNEEALARVHAPVTGRVLRSEERRVGKAFKGSWAGAREN